MGSQEFITRAPELVNYATKYLVNKEMERFKNHFTLCEASGITLTNDKIKDIIEVIKSLENRGILLKGTNTKFTSQEGGFLNFLRPLMTAGLP